MLLVLSYSGSISAQAFEYSTKKGPEVTRTVTLNSEKTQYTVAKGYFTSVCDLSFNTLSATNVEADKKNNYTMTRIGPDVKVTGTFKGAAVDQTVAIGNAPWYADLAFCLQQMAKTGAKKVEFVGVADLKPAQFTATFVGTENYTRALGGTAIPAVKINVVTSLAPSFLWSADSWYRASSVAI